MPPPVSATRETPPTPPCALAWTIDTDRLGDDGTKGSRQADTGERAALAKALGVMSVEALAAEFALQPLGAGRFRLSGRVSGSLTQPCVVTLEPVVQHIDEPIAADLWPAGQISPETRAEVEVRREDDPEPLDGSDAPIGRIVYEAFAAAVELYPRAPGAALELPGEASTAKESPFAVLARLKAGRTDANE